jgi:PAS domain S-box-containing protein
MVDLSASVPNAVFQELFEHSPACLALFEAADPFKVLVHNRAFQQVLDPPYSGTGVIGKTLPEFATNPDAVLQVFRQVAETGEPFVIDNYRYDGLERGPTWWNWSLTPVYREGVLTSLALTSVEVTEAVQAQSRIERETQARQEAERQLAGEQELLKRIIDIIPVMITVYDTKRQLLLLNGEFERLSGWSTEDAATRDIFEACYPDPDYREEVSRFMAKCEGWKDIQMTLRDGSVLETSWANVRLSDDRQVGIGLNLTDRRAAERSLEASRRELAEERAFLEAVIETAPIGISVARDPQSRPPIINAEARQMIGRRDLVGGLERYSALPLKHLDGRPYAHDDLAIIRAMREGSETTNREIIY